MQRTLIHIGYHKTASSYLQHVIFPQLPVNLFNPDEYHLKLIGNENPEKAELFRDWIAEEVNNTQNSNKKITIISHEALSGHPHGYKKIQPFVIADNLAKVFPDSRILIVIRNQFDYIASLYAFRVAVKGEEYRSFDNFVKFAGTKGLFEHLEYHLLIEYYQSLFGKEKVLVLPMELLVRTPEKFIMKIMNFLEMPNLIPNIGTAVNVSTKASLILGLWRPINFFVFHLIRAIMAVSGGKKQDFRSLTYRFHNLKQKITPWLVKIIKTSKKIDVRQISDYSALFERFSISNALLQKQIELDLSALGYPVKVDSTP